MSILIVFDLNVIINPDANTVVWYIANEASMTRDTRIVVGRLKAGNYPVVRIRFHGDPVTPENPLIVTVQSKTDIVVLGVTETPYYSP